MRFQSNENESGRLNTYDRVLKPVGLFREKVHDGLDHKELS